jgi:hypothetical protein
MRKTEKKREFSIKKTRKNEKKRDKTRFLNKKREKQRFIIFFEYIQKMPYHLKMKIIFEAV